MTQTFADHRRRLPFAFREIDPEVRREVMPAGDLFIVLTAHPGQGRYMLQTFDPAVVDEANPLLSDDAWDMYNPANDYRPFPETSAYPEEWVAEYRARQRERVARLDRGGASRRGCSRTSGHDGPRIFTERKTCDGSADCSRVRGSAVRPAMVSDLAIRPKWMDVRSISQRSPILPIGGMLTIDFGRRIPPAQEGMERSERRQLPALLQENPVGR